MIDASMIWHVVFHPSNGEWWSGRYRHVSLAGWSNETWLNLDLQARSLSAAPIFHYEGVEDYLSLLLTHYTVVRFGPSLKGRGRYLRPLTCVSFVKHVLGVRSSALLPDGLLRSLIRDYGSEMLNEVATSPKRNAGAKGATHHGAGGQPPRDAIEPPGSHQPLS